MIAVLRLFRFPLVFTAAADSAAGYLIALRLLGLEPALLEILLLAAASGGLYCFGMAMNDVADLERDRTVHPDRVLPSGRITRRGAVIASLAVLAVSGAAIAVVPTRQPCRLAVWGTIVLLILTYDFFLKWPPLMGLIRGFNFLLGFSCVDVDLLGPAVHLFTVTSFIYVTALTFASTFEERRMDRRGPRIAWAACVLGMVAGAVAPPFLPRAWGGESVAVRPAALAVSALLAGWIMLRARRVGRRPAEVKLLVRDGVAGIILLDASMVMSWGAFFLGLAVAALILPAAFGVWLFRRLH